MSKTCTHDQSTRRNLWEPIPWGVEDNWYRCRLDVSATMSLTNCCTETFSQNDILSYAKEQVSSLSLTSNPCLQLHRLRASLTTSSQSCDLMACRLKMLLISPRRCCGIATDDGILLKQIFHNSARVSMQKFRSISLPSEMSWLRAWIGSEYNSQLLFFKPWYC